MVQAWFLSDLHLKSESESNSKKLLLFLHSIEQEKTPATHLFLVGDIFDLWIHSHGYFIEKFPKIVNAIRVLVAKGIEVHYFEGNHDLYLRKFWQQDVGVRVHEGPEFFNLGQSRIRVEHGDQMNPNDRGYLFLRSFLRSGPITLLAKNLPGVTVSWIGERASRASRHYTTHQKKLHEEKVKEFMHVYTQKVIQERVFDFHFHGHTHVHDVFEFEHQGEQIFSVNLGSWFGEQKALFFSEGQFEFRDI